MWRCGCLCNQLYALSCCIPNIKFGCCYLKQHNTLYTTLTRVSNFMAYIECMSPKWNALVFVVLSLCHWRFSGGSVARNIKWDPVSYCINYWGLKKGNILANSYSLGFGAPSDRGLCCVGNKSLYEKERLCVCVFVNLTLSDQFHVQNITTHMHVF